VERTTPRTYRFEYVFAVWQAEHRDNICRVIEATRTFGERKSAKRSARERARSERKSAKKNITWEKKHLTVMCIRR